jgi:hypothetical protein
MASRFGFYQPLQHILVPKTLSFIHNNIPDKLLRLRSNKLQLLTQYNYINKKYPCQLVINEAMGGVIAHTSINWGGHGFGGFNPPPHLRIVFLAIDVKRGK